MVQVQALQNKGRRRLLIFFRGLKIWINAVQWSIKEKPIYDGLLRDPKPDLTWD